ncbi:hypothetical protein GW943_02020 [Candidatus Parcubacteria bacterium]|uniref:Uncharacterized protein n=1 Tax=Candidatus Kaiserbacteria bacterium CG10_big_fil_rev_8_21_14_0_10_47_16 TaxID=1974608 RepID=A0A2H0UGJ7_9BACT|nr:hypothetical protein [Candidatus Parcubacteria bacterium]PIR84806.1 MAG: hypothetical protein COU16_01310 [Candidatus Kaiserbacteria bacterium CG10_big_fil_rev_8_21_14_0_10_47_16]
MYNIRCWFICIAVALGLSGAPAWADNSSQFERFKAAPKKKPLFGEELSLGITAKLNSQNQNIMVDAKWALDSQQIVRGAVSFSADGGGSYGCSLYYEYKPWQTLSIHVQLDYRQYIEHSRVVALVGTQLWSDGPSPRSSITLDYQFAVYGSEGDKLLLRFRNKF